MNIFIYICHIYQNIANISDHKKSRMVHLLHSDIILLSSPVALSFERVRERVY